MLGLPLGLETQPRWFIHQTGPGWLEESTSQTRPQLDSSLWNPTNQTDCSEKVRLVSGPSCPSHSGSDGGADKCSCWGGGCFSRDNGVVLAHMAIPLADGGTDQRAAGTSPRWLYPPKHPRSAAAPKHSRKHVVIGRKKKKRGEVKDNPAGCRQSSEW